MPVCIITPEHLIDPNAPCAGILRDAGFEVVYPKDGTLARGRLSDEATIDELKNVDAVIAGGESYSATVLKALPKLRVVARSGVGYDRVDVPTATSRKIALAITPTANHECVAEHALAMMLAAAKNVLLNDAEVRAGQWARQLTEPIRGKTIGLIGLGRIGRSMAVRVRALGMNVLVHERYPDLNFVEQHNLKLVDLPQLLAESDYVSLHCPATPETANLIRRETLALMKPGSTLVNTARGSLVAEADLAEALHKGHLRAACIDVFAIEPPLADNPLLHAPNVILAPHLGGMDKLSLENMGIESARNIVGLKSGVWPTGAIVNDELRAGWAW